MTASTWDADLEYSNMLANLLDHGTPLVTRNAPVRRLRGYGVIFVTTPLICARRTAWKNALREWEWFMSGSNDINTLHPRVRDWWSPWADQAGLVHNNYSVQFRDARGHGAAVDQVTNLIDGLTHHPYSRRHIITTWNAADMVAPETPITNCHNTMTQFFVEPDNTLHMDTHQRSADTVCGVPHNWIQSWAFLMWLAHRSGRVVGTMDWKGGDTHLYDIHTDLAQKVVAQDLGNGAPPVLVYTPTSEEFKADDFTLSGPYTPLLEDKAVMVV